MTIFSKDQLEALNAPLDRKHVKTREQSGRKLSYVEGWHVIAEANRIFGFDGWSSETIETKCVAERDREIGRDKVPGFGVTYIARVLITVGDITREGCGTGHGIDRDLGQAHESAIKEAETDARKRALMTFGNQFGLALYDKEQVNVCDEDEISARKLKADFIRSAGDIIRLFEDSKELVAWWNSADQKQARRDFELDAIELEALKSLLIDRKNILANKEAA